ncbi:unnamed protein product [Caenorhabditis nigoni]
MFKLLRVTTTQIKHRANENRNGSKLDPPNNDVWCEAERGKRCSSVPWIRHRNGRRGGWRSCDHIQKAVSAVEGEDRSTKRVKIEEPRVKINKDRWTSDKVSWILGKYTVPHKFQSSATDGCSVWTGKQAKVPGGKPDPWPTCWLPLRWRSNQNRCNKDCELRSVKRKAVESKQRLQWNFVEGLGSRQKDFW